MRSRFIERLCELLFSWRASQKNATIQADRHKTYRIEPTFWFWNDLHLLPKIVLLSKSYVRRSKESLFLLLTSCFEHLTAGLWRSGGITQLFLSLHTFRKTRRALSAAEPLSPTASVRCAFVLSNNIASFFSNGEQDIKMRQFKLFGIKLIGLNYDFGFGAIDIYSRKNSSVKILSRKE